MGAHYRRAMTMADLYKKFDEWREQDERAYERILVLLDKIEELTYSADGKQQVRKMKDDVTKLRDEARADRLSGYE